MFCGKCGRQLPGDTKFCPFCGRVVAARSDAASKTGFSAEQSEASRKTLRSGRAGLSKAILIVIVAVVVLGVGALIIRGVTGSSSVVTDGNPAGYILQAGKTTYCVLNNYENKIIQILAVDDREGATAKELYSVSYSSYDAGNLYLKTIKSGTLYFTEARYSGGSVLYTYKSLNIKKANATPKTIELHMKKGSVIPDEFLKEYESTKSKFFLEELYFSAADKKYSYAAIAYGDCYDKALLFRLNWEKGEVECIEGCLIGKNDKWAVMGIWDEFIYYEIISDGKSLGLFRTDINKFKTERLLASLGEDRLILSIRVVGNTVYYLTINLNTHQWEFYYLESGASGGVPVSAVQPTSYFSVLENIMYVFNGSDLYCCDLDGGNDRLLIGDEETTNTKTCIGISGKWLYYFDVNYTLYRVKLDDTSFPTKSLS